MPFYEYECPTCKSIKTELHGMNETPKLVCTLCNIPYKRIMSAPLAVDGNFTPKYHPHKNI